MEIICFHNPNEENGYLSNWIHPLFFLHGVEYVSVEQYTMHQKAVFFKDFKMARKILDTETLKK